jgi:5'-phosphate synthase pdxT subunit
MTRRVGILAFQGDVREHAAAISACGAAPASVRSVSELASVDALVIPGGESTTIGKMAVRFGLLEPMRSAIEEGLPTYGTCAGLILMAAAVTDGDQPLLGVLDVLVRRNAFGRQNESFETGIEVAGFDSAFPAVFIRAPWIEKLGAGVETLAAIDGHAVMVRSGNLLATSFHPELTGDPRIHEMLIESI